MRTAPWCALLLVAPWASGQKLMVTNDESSGPGSLRQVLIEVSSQPGEAVVEIGFDAEFFAESRLIKLVERLPILRRSVVIDGPPLGEGGVPMVTLSGDANESSSPDAGDVAGLHLELPAGGSAVIRRLTFERCLSTATPGGAVYFRPDGPARLEIEDCVFNRNVGRWGGAVSMGGEGHEGILRGCLFRGNVATVFDGGAVHLGGTPALVDRCLFLENTAPHGGALHTFHGSAEIRGCLFDSNQTMAPGRGGAISARHGIRIAGTTFVNNGARTGGALFLSAMAAPAPGARIENSTFSANVATAGSGGAIYAINADVLLRHATLTLNHANSGATADPFVGGGAIAVPEAASVNQIRLHNCLIAENRLSGTGPAATADLQGPAASFVSLGGNVLGVGNHLAAVWSESADRFGSLEAPLAPKLDPLNPNGGTLPTHLPQPDSPTVDAGVSGPDPVIAVDQRGVARPVGAAPDAGALEREP